MLIGILFIAILIGQAFILTRLIFFPYPELFINPYLVNHGLKPYQQIMDQHAPGLMFFPVNLGSLGMTTPEVSRIWLISIVLITQLILFFISAKVLKNYPKALLVSLVYLIWQPFFEGTTFWIDSMLPIFLLPAFYTFYRYVSGGEKGQDSLVVITGLFLGMAVIFKQVVIPLSAAVMLYMFWQSKKLKTMLIYLAGFLPPILLMLLYFLAIGVIRDFWYWSVVFNLTTFAEYGKKGAPSVAHYLRVIFVFLMSSLAVFSKDKKIIISILIFLIGSLAGALARFDFVHFQPALPFVSLATVVGFSSIAKHKIAKWLMLIYILVTGWWLSIFYKGHISNEVVLYDQQTINLAEKIKGYTKPGEKIFILGVPLHLYQITKTLPAGDIFYIQAPWYVMIAQDQTLQGIIKDRPSIVIMDRSFIFEGYKIVDYAKAVDEYLINNYSQIDQVGSVQIMRQKNSLK